MLWRNVDKESKHYKVKNNIDAIFSSKNDVKMT